jgi:hypothetical protein
MRLAGAAYIKHSPDSAIDVLKPDGSKAMSLKTFLKHWSKTGKQAQQLQGLWVVPPACAAAAGGSQALASKGCAAAGGGEGSAGGATRPAAAAAAKAKPVATAKAAAATTKATAATKKAPKAAGVSADQVQHSTQQHQKARSGKPAVGSTTAVADAAAGVTNTAGGDSVLIPIDPDDVVEVVCGAEKGWYSSSRDQVLPLSGAPAASKLRKANACSKSAPASAWLSTAGFRALARAQDAELGNAAAIHVVGPDGAKGVTLQAHMKGLMKAKQQPQALQQVGTKPRAVASAAPAAKAAAASTGAAKPPKHPKGVSAAVKTAPTAPTAAAASGGRQQGGQKGALVPTPAPWLDTLAAAAAAAATSAGAAMTPNAGLRTTGGSSSGPGKTRGSIVAAAAAFCLSPRSANLMLADEQVRDAAESLVELRASPEPPGVPTAAAVATAAAGQEVAAAAREGKKRAATTGASSGNKRHKS